jgi:16S rRNA processing protein RimM
MNEFVVMGKVVGSHGIKGWLKIQPFTEETKTLGKFPSWFLSKDESEWKEFKVESSSIQGRTVLSKIEHVNDRNDADQLRGFLIGINKIDLPALEKGKYYWSELIGLEVINQNDFNFGVIDSIMETGSNDVLVIKDDKETLIPYLDNVVLKIDLERKNILVDWDENF